MTRRRQDAASRRLLRPLAATSVLGLLAVTLSGCSFDWTDVVGFGWPKGITPEAQANYKFWLGMVLASVIIGLMVWGAMFWAMFFFRKKKGDDELPKQFGYNMPLELALTVLPFVAVAIIFYFTVVVQEKMLHQEPNPDVVVDVTAFQWNWNFGYQKVEMADLNVHYNGEDLDRKAAMASRPEGVDEHGNERVGGNHGLNPEDRTFLNFDKIETLGTSDEVPVLVLPSGKRIQFVLNSADVVHAFWVPEFLFKRDVIPEPKANGQVNTFQVEKILQEGAFVGHCAEMCGTYHAMMNFEVRVVSPNNFKAYLEQREAGKSNAEALAAIGEAPLAVKTHPFDSHRGLLAPRTSNK